MRFVGKVIRFLPIDMRKQKYYISRLRQCSSLRYATIVILWIVIVVSIPIVNIDSISVSSQVQRIISQDRVPATSPRYLTKSTLDYPEFSIIHLNDVSLKKQYQTYVKYCYSTNTQLLTNSLIYTQTTSSFL